MLAEKIECILTETLNALETRRFTLDMLQIAILNLHDIAVQVREMEKNAVVVDCAKTKKSIRILKDLHEELLDINFPTDGKNHICSSDNDNKNLDIPDPEAA